MMKICLVNKTIFTRYCIFCTIPLIFPIAHRSVVSISVIRIGEYFLQFRLNVASVSELSIIGCFFGFL